MFRPPRVLGLLVAAILAMVSLGGCFIGVQSCALGPLQTVRPAGLVAVPPINTGRDTNTGVCPWIVEFDGKPYHDTRASHVFYNVWTITAEELTAIGHASRATPGVPPIVDDTVYSVDGVNPAEEAIAMRPSGPNTDVVILVEGVHFPESLCRYLTTAPTRKDLCPGAGGASPSPSG